MARLPVDASLVEGHLAQTPAVKVSYGERRVDVVTTFA